VPSSNQRTAAPPLGQHCTRNVKVRLGTHCPGIHGTLSEGLADRAGPPLTGGMGIVIPLYKGKGPRTMCSSYRPISLLSVPGKVFAHILLGRLGHLLADCRRPQQSGFTAGKSTADAILALRLLAEIHAEFRHPLRVAYVDMKSAFDSVDCEALWKSLREIETPEVVLRYLRDLYTGSGARVRVNKATSERFTLSSGVRQGSVLAPVQFNRAIDWVMERCVRPQWLGGWSLHLYRPELRR